MDDINNNKSNSANYTNSFVDEDDRRFEEAKSKNTKESYDSYLKDFPDGKHRQEVKALRKALDSPTSEGDSHASQGSVDSWKKYDVPMVKRIKDKSRSDISDKQFADELENFLGSGELTKEQLVALIKDDNNLLSRGVIKDLTQKGWLYPEDLLSAGIDDDFIYAMRNFDEHDGPDIGEAETPTSIAQPTTEVYFWGIPSSGKSCVMAALMSVLKSGKVGEWEARECKGGDYMNQLAMLYEQDKVRMLLPGTPLMSTYEMAFNLTRMEISGKWLKKTETLVHPFTFIDLAGGILYLMYDYQNRRNIMADEPKEYLETIEKLIIGTSNDKKGLTNRKMHCFVIEYGADDWRFQGLDQLTYLGSALRYIERTKIFENKATDSIYVIVTKVDRSKLSGEDLITKVKEYVTDEETGYYANFYNRLKGIVEKCEINGGQVQIVPFTIGDVKMRSLCKFNGTAAKALMEKLVQRSIGFDMSKLGQLQDRFSE